MTSMPQLLATQVSSRLTPRRRDASPTIFVYVIALFGIPAALIVAPLGAAGTPAQIIGVAMFAWWAASRLVRRTRPTARNPVHWLIGIFAAAILASYVAGMSRPITSLELNSADRALISLAAWCGVMLIVSEGIRSRIRAWHLVQLIAGAAGFLAVLGLLQYFLGLDLAQYIKLPGLSANSAYGTSLDRSGFRRVTATAGHPIEYGVVLAALLPLVMHCALYAPSVTQRRRWWAVAIVAGLALPMSLARSAFIGAALAVLVMYPTWPRRARRRIVAATLAGAFALSVVVPGLLGTMRSLFLNIDSDPSTQGRKDDYGPAAQYFQQHPFSGRGFGTFIPEIYRTLDNQYLGLLLEVGVIGTMAFLALLIGSIACAAIVRRSTTDAVARDLAQSLIAGIVVIGVNSATFDTFGFAMCTGTLTLLIGLVGWLWADRHRRSIRRPNEEPRRRFAIKPRAAVVVSVLLLTWFTGVWAAAGSETEWRSLASVVLVTRQTPGTGAFYATPRASLVASVLHDAMDDPSVRQKLAAERLGNYEVAVGDGSLAMGTDRIGYGPILWFSAEAATQEQSQALLAAVLSEADTRLYAWQTAGGGVPPQLITTQHRDQPAFAIYGSRSRMIAGLAALTLVLGSMGLWMRRERRLQREFATRPVVSGSVSS